MDLKDIPLASACIVNHNAHGAFVMTSGDSLSQEALHNNDYNGREGQYEEKEGVEIEPTREDIRLREEFKSHLSEDALRNLEYTERSGKWADKGADQMLDCRHWNRDGYVTREELDADMLACGGHFMKTVIAIDRRYANDLGFTEKEDFQRLVRNSWVNSVMKWGVPGLENPNDVHWVAEFHTDSETSLHVHVTTWFSRGIDVPDEWKISAACTRDAKQEIYRDAYTRPRMAAELERDYLRQLIPAIARVELGRPIPEQTLESLQRKADERGYDFSPERTVGDDAVLERHIAAVQGEYAVGRGRISSNWKLEAAARDVFDRLYTISKPFQEAVDTYTASLEGKADMCGYAFNSANTLERGPKEDPEELSRAQEVTKHLREQFIADERDDLKHRTVSGIINCLIPDRESRQLYSELAKEICRSNGLFSIMRDPERYGVSRSEYERFVSDVSQARLAYVLSPEISQELCHAYICCRNAEGKLLLDPTASKLERTVVSELVSAGAGTYEHVTAVVRDKAGSDIGAALGIAAPAQTADEIGERAGASLASILVNAPVIQARIDEVLDREVETLTKSGFSRDEAQRLLTGSVEKSMAGSISFYASNARINALAELGREAVRDITREMSAEKSIYNIAVLKDGRDLGLRPSQYRELMGYLERARDVVEAGGSTSNQNYRNSLTAASRIIVDSPVFTKELDRASRSVGKILDRDPQNIFAVMNKEAVEKVYSHLANRVSYDVQHNRPINRELQEIPRDINRDIAMGLCMGVADLLSQLVQAAVRSVRGGQAYQRRRNNENEREQRYVDERNREE